MATYEELEQQELKKAKTQTAQYESQRRRLANTEKANVDQTYGSAIKQAETQYKQSAADTAASYREVYDLNAVSEQVARRNAEEAIANMNMANSGLNNTQQTAISLSRSRADAQTTKQKQDAVNAIMRELDSVRSEYTREATAQKSSIDSNADADIFNYSQAADEAAREKAATLYTADQDALIDELLSYIDTKSDSKAEAANNGEDDTRKGPATVNYTRQKDGKTYTGWEAGKYYVFDWAKKLWNDDAFDTEKTGKTKKEMLEEYVWTHYGNNNIEDEDTAEEIIYTVSNGLEI